LEFLGVERRLTPYQQNNNWILTKSDAPIQVFGLQYNKWEILADQAGVFLNQGG
jgi:hypothetical protein